MRLLNPLELAPSVATRAVTARVTRQFNASIECVFDAWLDPVTAGSFLFATEAGEVMQAEIDARSEGRFRFLRREKGTEVRRVGKYIYIDRPHLLAFTLSDSTRPLAQARVIIEFASIYPGSLLVLTQEMGLESYAERHRVESEWKRRLAMLAFLCPLPQGMDLSQAQRRSATLA